MKANCIRVRPEWMYEDRHIIGDIPLHALMLPGTHNSGAYDIDFGVSLPNSGFVLFFSSPVYCLDIYNTKLFMFMHFVRDLTV